MFSPSSRWRQLPVSVKTQSVRFIRKQKVIHKPADPPPGHGEKIFIYDHQVTGQVVYSLTNVLDSNKALKQLPFHGKKTKPTKLRKDYWQPMAMISFPPGCGEVGRSVFQKLREFRKMHELCWDDSLLGSKARRKEQLKNQRANTVADMAATLAGRGRGNLVLVDNAKRSRPPGEAPAAAARGAGGYYKANVHWANTSDRLFGEEWLGNVRHRELDVKAFAQTWPPRPPGAAADEQAASEQAADEQAADEQAAVESGDGGKGESEDAAPPAAEAAAAEPSGFFSADGKELTSTEPAAQPADPDASSGEADGAETADETGDIWYPDGEQGAEDGESAGREAKSKSRTEADEEWKKEGLRKL